MQREKQIQELSSRQLLSANEQFVFSHWATYQGGVAGYRNAAVLYGVAVVLSDSFVFLDKSILFKLPYMKVLEVKLDYFQPSAVRGFLAAGAVGVQLQQTQNILEIRYLNDKELSVVLDFRFMVLPQFQEKLSRLVNFSISYLSSRVVSHLLPV